MPEKKTTDLSSKVAVYFNEKVDCDNCETSSWMVDKVNFSYKINSELVYASVICKGCGNRKRQKLTQEVLREYVFR